MAKKRQKKFTIPQDPLASMLDRFAPLLNDDQISVLHQELANPAFPSLRSNPLKQSAPDFIQKLATKYQWELKPIPFCESGYWVTHSPGPISKTVEHSFGNYYIQDAASMLPVELFDFSTTKNPLILDMAASPGGKTTHLVSRTNDQALILANDSSRDRLTALKIVLQNWGSSHTAITNYAGELFGSWFPETFDYVLLDAPCSMQGLRDSDSHAIKPITQKEINQLAKRQQKLLDSALKAVKTGGQVVYSTCTLTLEENEMVLDAILNQYSGQIRIEPALNTIKLRAPAFTQVNEYSFNKEIAHAARIWPFSFGTAGFFAAKITKIKEINDKQKEPPSRSLNFTNWFPYPEIERKVLVKKLEEQYGFDLDFLIQDHHWEIWQYKNTLHCFPAMFLQHFPDFPVQALGLPLAEITGGDYILAHEFVTRFGHLASANIYTVENDLIPIWMRGEDLPNINLSANTILIVKDYEGRILGRGKPSGNRLRNMLPRRILIPDLPAY